MCNLLWCYTFCTSVTLFALVLHLNCTALSQLEWSNFFLVYYFKGNGTMLSTTVTRLKKLHRMIMSFIDRCTFAFFQSVGSLRLDMQLITAC